MRIDELNYCPVCGKRMGLKACAGADYPVPFCDECETFRFPQFNVAVSAAIVSKDAKRIMMMRQYGREKYNHLAGYLELGEDAETALRREVSEEMSLRLASFRYLYSEYYAKSNTLMMCYLCEAEEEDLVGRNAEEVDDARWFSWEEAEEAVIKGSVAERLLANARRLKDDRFEQ